MAIAVACSAASNDGDDDTAGNGSANSGGTGTALFTSGGSGPGGGGPSDGCSEAAKLVYVLSDQAELYSFKPDERIFTFIGQMQCPTPMQPNSMAIDRSATAWVNFVQGDSISDTAGALFRVSTIDASCEAAPAVNMPTGFFRVGMGYSTDGPDTEAETLYVTGIGIGGELARIDQNGLTPIGQFTGVFANQNAELTGTGDGRLYSFFTSVPVQVAELDKSSAAILTNVPLPAVEIPNAWAFSFWGGDFYLYTAVSPETSQVNRYRPSDGSVDTQYVPDVGFTIVGAGVSTCAPVAPPN